MSAAKEFYDKVKHQDTWNVDVVYPNSVESIIEISKIEGILLGLEIAKNAYAKNLWEDMNIQEIHYKKLLSSLLQ